MTIEELQQLFEAYKGEQDAVVAGLKGEIGAVLKNRNDILGEKKALQSELRKLQEQGPTPASDGLANPKNAPGSDDIAAMIAKAVAEASKPLRETLERSEKEKADLAIGQSLADAFEANKVEPAFRKAALAMFRTGHKLSLEDGQVYADGQKIGDVVKSWVDSEDGKPFISASQHRGSNAAPGVPASGHSKTKRRSEMTRAEKGAFVAVNGQDAYRALPE